MKDTAEHGGSLGVPKRSLPEALSTNLVLKYADRTKKTVTRDVNALVDAAGVLVPRDHLQRRTLRGRVGGLGDVVVVGVGLAKSQRVAVRRYEPAARRVGAGCELCSCASASASASLSAGSRGTSE